MSISRKFLKHYCACRCHRLGLAQRILTKCRALVNWSNALRVWPNAQIGQTRATPILLGTEADMYQSRDDFTVVFIFEK